MRFKGQHPEEKVIFILKKHPAVLFRPALWLTLLTLVPIFAFIYFKFSWVFSYAFFLWLFLGGFYLAKTFYCFSNSKYILTSDRLIKINQKGFLHKTVSEMPLSKIQNVSYEIKGFWASLFEFGTVFLQTAGEMNKISLEFIEEPKKIQEQVLEGLKGVRGVEEPEPKEEIKKEKPTKKIPSPNFWD